MKEDVTIVLGPAFALGSSGLDCPLDATHTTKGRCSKRI